MDVIAINSTVTEMSNELTCCTTLTAALHGGLAVSAISNTRAYYCHYIDRSISTHSIGYLFLMYATLCAALSQLTEINRLVNDLMTDLLCNR